MDSSGNAITDPGNTSYDQFGISVAISGTNAVVGAFGTSTGAGAVYFYAFTSSTPTTTVVTSNHSSLVQGQSVTLHASVSPTAATGTVAFSYASAALPGVVAGLTTTTISGCSAQVVTSGVATCTTSSLPVGSNTISAVYSGDATYATSTGTMTQDVVAVAQAPTITTQPTAQSVNARQSATFSVVAVSNDSGTLSYEWQVYVHGEWEEIYGATSASYTTSPLNVTSSGSLYRVVVTNTTSPSTNRASVTSSTVLLTVNPLSATTSISLLSSSPYAGVGIESREVFRGVVTGITGDGYPKGTVKVYKGGPSGVLLCTANLNGSGYQASYSCAISNNSALAIGVYSSLITALYVPASPSSSSTNYTYSASTSSALSLEVKPTVTITFKANGASGTMANEVVIKSVAQTLNTVTFTRSGYTFLGWALSANGAKLYNNAGSVNLSVNTTLYALWRKNS